MLVWTSNRANGKYLNISGTSHAHLCVVVANETWTMFSTGFSSVSTSITTRHPHFEHMVSLSSWIRRGENLSVAHIVCDWSAEHTEGLAREMRFLSRYMTSGVYTLEFLEGDTEGMILGVHYSRVRKKSEIETTLREV